MVPLRVDTRLREAGGSLRAVFLLGSAPGRPRMFLFLSVLTRKSKGEQEDKGTDNKREGERERDKRERMDVLKCDSCAKNSCFLPPCKHPAAGSMEAQLDTR